MGFSQVSGKSTRNKNRSNPRQSDARSTIWIYDLRLADAHLASQELSDALSKVRVDQNAPYVTQGYQLLHACVSSIYGICHVIEGWGSTIKENGL